MDRKTLAAVAVCVLLLFLWGPLVNQLWPPVELTPEQLAARQTNTVSRSTAPPPNPDGTNPPSALTDVTTPAPVGGSLTGDNAEDQPTTTAVLENEEMRLTFTSRSGGIQLFELKEFDKFVSRSGREEEAVATLNEYGQYPVLGLLEDLSQYELDVFGDRLTATATWANGLLVTKEFTLTSNYVIAAKVTIENPSDADIVLPDRAWSVGTSSPLGNNMDPQFTGLLWFDGEDKEEIVDSWFENRLLGCFPREPRPVYAGGLDNVEWGGVQNQFFTIITIPEEPAAEIVSRRVNLPPPSELELEHNPKTQLVRRGHETALVYRSTTVPAGGSLERHFDVFAGPKEYNTLSALSMREGKRGLDLVMNFSGFFGFFAKPLLLSMNALHNMTGMGYGIAIVVITFIIRLVFWPLTNASTKSMKRMAKLQPQMKAIQEKYKDDPQKMQKKTLEFMRENKVNPMGSCLPMLLQLPVFFGFFTMLRSAIELRGASFLWIADLSQPDTLFYLPGLGWPFNLMPLIMGATMLYQARLTPMSPGMDPAQQKLMRYMPLLFMVFLYNMSSGLTLYWSVSNVLSIIQTKLTRINDEKQEVQGPAAKPNPVALPSGKTNRKKKGQRPR